ncbi:hypothetical protein Rhopal_006160-T1 [Rhodotorula paludigena]|uniref:Uncharacterized protein n=1 Tax=Rhodotorula paludigena TaxID=86838 RepID=A0AAV5GT78_9BASI|nr:hypothetical protein Rhopal_006160-T1 [Rhodotorula paludigena]
MPLRRGRTSSADESSRAAKRLARIDDAFNRAAGYDAEHYAALEASLPARGGDNRRRTRAAVVDDEEDEDFEMVASTEQGAEGAAAGEVGGGFLPEPPAADTGGGFIVDEPSAAAGGGFLPEPSAAGGGGFLPEPDNVGGGGFLPEPAQTGEGGGFLVDDAGGFLPDPAAPSFDAGGGFLPPDGDTAMPDYGMSGGFLPLPPNLASADADFSGSGGFLPDSDALPEPVALAHALPTPPPPPSRIPLVHIPAALRDLGLHRVGLAGAELLGLFEEVASDDDEAEGGRSVRRERFKEACEVLMGDDDESDEEGEGNGDGEGDKDEYREEDEELGEGRRRRRSARQQPARRSTRGRAARTGEGNEEASTPDITARDFGASLDALPDDDDELSSVASDSESDEGASGSSARRGKKGAGGKGKAKKGGKARASRGDASRPLSARDLADAGDSFDLFFEESPQMAFPQSRRTIGLMELQRACRVLKEKMSEGDMNEMVEYAARSKGIVDLEAFARILIETNL